MLLFAIQELAELEERVRKMVIGGTMSLDTASAVLGYRITGCSPEKKKLRTGEKPMPPGNPEPEKPVPEKPEPEQPVPKPEQPVPKPEQPVPKPEKPVPKPEKTMPEKPVPEVAASDEHDKDDAPQSDRGPPNDCPEQAR